MPGRIESRLAELGIALPEPQQPKVARIENWVIADRALFVSGQIPQWNGERRFIGKVGGAFDLEQGRAAARLSALNVLAHARAALGGDLDLIERVVKLKGYVNATPDFTEPPAVVNGCSDALAEVLGPRGRHTRSAFGVATLPAGVAVEVEAIVEVRA